MFDIVDKLNINDRHSIDLVSDKPKVFIRLALSFYHFYHDCFGEFLLHYEQMPDAQYIIDITAVSDMNPLPSHVKMFFIFLKTEFGVGM